MGVYATRRSTWRFHVQTFAVLTSGIVVLLPELSMYHSVFELVQHDDSPPLGIGTLLDVTTASLVLAPNVRWDRCRSEVLRADRT